MTSAPSLGQALNNFDSGSRQVDYPWRRSYCRATENATLKVNLVPAQVQDLAQSGDDRVMILGALLWMADKLQSNQGERARALWPAKRKQAFEADPAIHEGTDRTPSVHP